MQALILVGGEGTRLRPLTARVPKPVVPLAGRPFMSHQLAWLRRHGIDDVILSCGFLADGVRDVLGDGSALGVRLRYVEEPEPLGTGGAVKYAEALLDERFLMLNGDVLTDMDLSAQIAQHERTGAQATLALVPVEDPSAYGLVRLREDRSVREFVEKPAASEIDTNLISAGAYVLERGVLDLLEHGVAASIERAVFPRLVDGRLYGFAHETAYWLDIGTPERYLAGTADILEGRVVTPLGARPGGGYRDVAADADVDPGQVAAPAIVGAGTVVGDGARIGARTVLGAGVRVGARTTIERAVVLDGAEIGPDCELRDCIVAAGARVGDGCRIGGLAVVGPGAAIGAGNVLDRGMRIFPDMTIPDAAVAF